MDANKRKEIRNFFKFFLSLFAQIRVYSRAKSFPFLKLKRKQFGNRLRKSLIYFLQLFVFYSM